MSEQDAAEKLARSLVNRVGCMHHDGDNGWMCLGCVAAALRLYKESADGMKRSWDTACEEITKLKAEIEAARAEIEKWRKLNDEQRISDAAFYSKMILRAEAERDELRKQVEQAASEIDTRRQQYRKAVETIYDLRQELDQAAKRQRSKDAEIVKQAHFDYCNKTNRYPCTELAEYQVKAILAQDVKE